MNRTRTGSFPIGFRVGWSGWQKDLDTVIAFADTSGFAGIDVGHLPVEKIKRVLDSGLRVGSVDLRDWSLLASEDGAVREEAADANADYIRQVSALGVTNFLAVVFPGDDAMERQRAHELAVAGWGALAERVSGTGAQIVYEGYPGSPPHYPALACTPESCRALIRDIPGDAVGINFDPSHLIRMGIDPVRFLKEFAPHIRHVHAKDTQLFDDGLYEFGNLQSAVFAKPHGFGRHHWRYTIPGDGCAPWSDLFQALADSGYAGMVSIELEDEHYNGTEQGEKKGLLASREFLLTV